MNYYTAKYLIRPLLFIAAIAAIIISTTMNARFGYSLGETPIDSVLLSGFSISLDVFKAFALAAGLFLLASRKRSNKLIGFAALLVWTVGVVWSLTSSFGFYASNGVAAETTAIEANDKRSGARADVARLNTELATLRTNQRYGWTKGCTHILYPESQRLCDTYKTKSAQLAAASLVVSSTALIPASPQIIAFKRLTGATAEQIKSALGMMFSIFSELFTALSMIIVLSPFAKRKTAINQTKKAKKREARKSLPRKTPVRVPDFQTQTV